MKKVISTLLCIVMVCAIYIPLNVTADGLAGKAGKIPDGGEKGVGGGARSRPCFRIGLINEDFPNPIDYDKPVLPQVKAHYKNHFPNMENPRIWVPGEYDDLTYNDIKLVWCETSSGDLYHYPKADNSKVIQFMDNKNIWSGFDIFYYELLKKVKNYDLSTIGDSWLDVYKSVDKPNEKCKGIINYIFYQWNDIGKKSIIKKVNDICHYKELSSEISEQIKNKVGYLQMLMILYGAADDTYKETYKNAIDRYINWIDMDTNPVLIAIDTVTIFNSPSWGSEQQFFPSTEYVEYAASLTEANRLTNPNNDFFANNHDTNFIGSRHQEEIMLAATRKSVKERKKLRITELKDEAYRTTPTSWGASLVYGHSHYLRTVDNKVQFVDSEHHIVGMIEAIQFIDGVYEGFAISSLDNMNPPPLNPTGSFGISTSPPPIEILAEGSITIGKNNIVKITGSMTKTEEDVWNDVICDPGYPKIKVTLTSDMTSNKRKSSHVNGYTGNKLYSTQVTGDNGDPNNEASWTPKSKEDLINFLNGSTPIVFTHDLIDQEIEEEENQKYTYKATIQIKTSKDGKIITLTGNPDTALKIYKNPKKPYPVYRDYYSTPSFWSEIKQGSPYNESFEAMAGVPTTRSLYFATGGSEFIIDINLEYCENQKATRKYKSYFTGVPSEYMEVDQAGDYTVGGFSLNGHKGGTYTKTWSGNIPWTGSHSHSGWHGGSVSDKWDYSDQKADLKAAQEYADEVNGTTISHEAPSDGIT